MIKYEKKKKGKKQKATNLYWLNEAFSYKDVSVEGLLGSTVSFADS